MTFLTCTTAFDVKAQMEVLGLATVSQTIRVQKLPFPFYSMKGLTKSLYTINTCLQVLIEFYLVHHKNICFLHVLNHSEHQNLSVSHYLL